MGAPMKTDARPLRHASVPAMYDWQRRGFLRWALLEHYDDDDDFRRDLPTLALPSGDDRGRVAEFAARYGLDRLIADEHNDDGIALLCDWVYWSRQSPGRDLELCSVAGFGGAVAELAVEDRIAWDPAREPRPDARRRLVRLSPARHSPSAQRARRVDIPPPPRSDVQGDRGGRQHGQASR